MRTITILARESFDYQGRTVVAGEVVEVLPVYAAAFTRQRKATFHTRELKPEVAAAPEPDPEPVETPRRRRGRKAYQTREMVAAAVDPEPSDPSSYE